MLKKEEIKSKSVQRPAKKCKECGSPTTNYYPVEKSKTGEIRCEECHMRSLRRVDEFFIGQR